MATQDLEITVRAHMCFGADEGTIESLAKRVCDVVGSYCNTVDVSARYDERGVTQDAPIPKVINIKLPRY